MKEGAPVYVKRNAPCSCAVENGWSYIPNKRGKPMDTEGT